MGAETSPSGSNPSRSRYWKFVIKYIILNDLVPKRMSASNTINDLFNVDHTRPGWSTTRFLVQAVIIIEKFFTKLISSSPSLIKMFGNNIQQEENALLGPAGIRTYEGRFGLPVRCSIPTELHASQVGSKQVVEWWYFKGFMFYYVFVKTIVLSGFDKASRLTIGYNLERCTEMFRRKSYC